MILHISHTCIRTDARILKELTTLSQHFGDSRISAIGLDRNKVFEVCQPEESLDITDMTLFTDILRSLPRPLRWVLGYPILVYCEFLIRIIYCVFNKKISVVHCHDYIVLPIGVLIKVAKRAILVYDSHELQTHRNGQSLAGRLFVRALEIFSWPQVDGFITVGDYIRRWYVKNYGSKKSVVILNSPVNECIAPNARLKVGFAEKDYYKFVYVGLFSAGRGIERLLSEFEGAKHELTLIGDGELLPRIVDAANRNHNIRRIQPVPYKKLLSILADYDVGVLLIPPSTSLSDLYSLPNKFFEYAASGCAVISTDLPEVSRRIRRYNLGIVVSENWNLKSILDGLRTTRFCTTPCESHFTWAREEIKLSSFYDDLLHSKSFRHGCNA